MNAYFPTAYAKAIDIARTATIEQHIIGDRYLFKTGIPDFYIIAGLAADEDELAEAVLCHAAIAQAIAKSAIGGMQ